MEALNTIQNRLISQILATENTQFLTALEGLFGSINNEGKKIALQISSGTNKYRYSSNNQLSQTELPSNESIFKLLARPAPFDVGSGRSHLDLAKEFTISKGGRKGFTVYIYIQDSTRSGGFKELKGSPFSTYGAGHEAIGVKRNSRVIGRYIDTGKVYKDKYLFASICTRF